MKKGTQLGIILSLFFVLIQSQNAYPLSLSMAENGLTHSSASVKYIKMDAAVEGILAEKNNTPDENFILSLSISYEYDDTSESAENTNKTNSDSHFLSQSSAKEYEAIFSQAAYGLMNSELVLEVQLEKSDSSNHPSPCYSLYDYENLAYELRSSEELDNSEFSGRIGPYDAMNRYTISFKPEAVYPLIYEKENPAGMMSAALNEPQAIVNPKYSLCLFLWMGLLSFAFRESHKK